MSSIVNSLSGLGVGTQTAKTFASFQHVDRLSCDIISR